MKYYAKIGTAFVTNAGYGKYPANLAKFPTADEAMSNAQSIKRLFKCVAGSIEVVQVAA